MRITSTTSMPVMAKEMTAAKAEPMTTPLPTKEARTDHATERNHLHAAAAAFTEESGLSSAAVSLGVDPPHSKALYFCSHAAAVHDDDAVAHGRDLAQHMRAEQHRRAALRLWACRRL